MSTDHVIIEIDKDSVRPERLRAGAVGVDLEQGSRGLVNEGADEHPYAVFHRPQQHSSMDNLIPIGEDGAAEPMAARG